LKAKLELEAAKKKAEEAEMKRKALIE